MFSRWESIINLVRYLFFKTVILENKVSPMYVKPNMVYLIFFAVQLFSFRGLPFADYWPRSFLSGSGVAPGRSSTPPSRFRFHPPAVWIFYRGFFVSTIPAERALYYFYRRGRQRNQSGENNVSRFVGFWFPETGIRGPVETSWVGGKNERYNISPTNIKTWFCRYVFSELSIQ